MTIDRAGAAWLSECWKPCPEVPLGERIEKRNNDRQQQRDLEEQAVHTPSPDVDKVFTGNPEVHSEGAA